MSGIDIRTKNGVLQQLETFATPFYSVYSGKDLKFYHIEDNMDSARDLLSSNLDMLEANGTAATFVIRFYDELNNAGKLVPENLKGSNTFRLTPNLNEYRSLAGAGVVIDSEQVRQLKEQNEILRAQLEAYQQSDDDDDDDDDAPEAPQGVGAIVGALFNNPQIQQVIISGAIKFIDKIMQPQQMQQAQPAAQMAGVSADDVQTSINELLKYCTADDLAKLAALPSVNPALFNILLTQLRSM